MQKDAKVFVAGHRGLVGSALVRALGASGYGNVLVRRHAELDLCRQEDVERFFEAERPDYVFLAAAKVGGIMANNTYPAEFIYSNLVIQTNVIHAAHQYGTRKLLFLGSSCIYPKFAPQPIREESLLTGELEPTNEPYAVAKIAGIKMCQSYMRQYGSRFLSVMPTNLYGPNDNFDLQSSHVLPALLRKFHEAKAAAKDVTLWGTGSPMREFLHVDDLAGACLFLMQNYEDGAIVNIGAGQDIAIKDLAGIVAETVGFKGSILWDHSKPDGTPRKLIDSSKLRALGWRPRIHLREGIKSTYEWFLSNVKC